MRTADGRKIWERFTQWKKLNLDRLSKLIFFFITPLQLVDIKTWPNILKSTPVADFPAVLNDNMVYWLNSTYRKQNTWMINYTGNIIQNTSTCSRFLQVPLGAVLPMQQTAINASIRPPSLEKFTVPHSYQWQLKLISCLFYGWSVLLGGIPFHPCLHWTLFSTDQIKDDSFFNSEGLVFHFTHTVLFYLEGPVWRSLVYI